MQDDRGNLDNKTLMSEKKNPSSSKQPEDINKENKENISPYITDYIYIIKK